MLINKSRYQISKDRKLMRKVGKQWVVVSAFVLALLGAKGAKTMIHASSTESPDQQVTNQINQRLQQSQKLVKQQNGSQSASVQNNNVQNNQSHSVTRPTANLSNHNIMQAASNLHAQVIAHNIMNPQSATDQSRASQADHDQTVQKPEQNNLGMTHNLGGADNVKTGTYDGLTYKYDTTTQSLEFTGGTINASDTLDFLNNPQFGGSYSSNDYRIYDQNGEDDYDNSDNHTSDSIINPGNVYNSDNDEYYQNSVLKSVKFDSDVDFSHVNNMHGMFEYDWALQSVNLPKSINTSNVTDMKGMFKHDPSLASLTIPTHFDASHVMDMNEMFKEDSDLKALNLPMSFNTNNVKDMGRMFEYDVLSDKTMNNVLSHLNVSHVTNMDDMFYSESGLNSLTIPNSFNPINVTSMGSMFSNDGSLAHLNLPSTFNTGNVNIMSDMFSNDGDLSDGAMNLILSHLSISNVVTMSNMLSGDHGLKNLVIPNTFNTSNVANMSWMFSGDSNLTNLTLPKSFDTSHVTDMKGMFYGDGFSDNGMEKVLADLNVSHVTNMNEMLDYNTNLHSLVVPNSFITNHVKETNSMFSDDDNLQSLTLPSSFSVQNDYDMSDMFNSDNALKVLNLPNDFGPNVPSSMAEMFKSDSSLSDKEMGTILSHLKTDQIRDMNGMLESDADLNALTVPDTFDTLNVRKTGGIHYFDHNPYNYRDDGMFKNDYLQSLTLPSSFNMKNNSDMSNMFEGNRLLKTLNLPNNFGPSVASNMSNMLRGDISLSDNEMKMILSTLKVDTVTNMSSMLESDSDLKALTIPNSFTPKNVSDMNSMFMRDDNLKTLNLPSNFSVNTSNVHNIGSMLKSDSYLSDQAMENILSHFNTNQISNMSNLLASDDDLKSLTIPNNINTSNVTNMSGMFKNDIALQKLTLPKSFDTRQVYDMDSMFYNDLHNLTIQSPNTKFSDNSRIGHPYPKQWIQLSNYTRSDWQRQAYIAANLTSDYSPSDNICSDFMNSETPNDFITDVFHTYNAQVENHNNNVENNHEPIGDLEVPIDAYGLLHARHDINNYNLVNKDLNGALDDLSSDAYPMVMYVFKNNATTRPWYKKLSQNGYTSPNANLTDNSDHRGTYVANSSNIPFETVNYTYNDKIVATQKINDGKYYDKSRNRYDLGENLDITQAPFGYQLDHPNNVIQLNGNVHQINVEPVPAVDNVEYQYDGHAVASTKIQGLYGLDFTINNHDDPGMPQNYQLVKFNQMFKYNDGMHIVPIEPDLATDTINYQYNSQTVGKQVLTGSDVNVVGANFTNFLLNNAEVPKGYHLANTNQLYSYTGQTYNVKVLPNRDTAKLTYFATNSSDVVGRGIITGDDNSTVDPTKQVPVPKGYHLSRAQNNYHFTNTNPATPDYNPSDTIYVQGNQIRGTATITLVYQRSNGQINMTKTVQVPLNSQIGNTITIDPARYNQKNYTPTSPIWLIPLTSRIAPDNSNLNYNLKHTFIYTGTEADVNLAYVNVSANGQLMPWVEDTGTGSDYNQYVNKEMSYQKNKYPVVGHQAMNDIGIEGQSVNFTSKGANLGTRNMIAPKGYHFINSDSNNRILPSLPNLNSGTSNVTSTSATFTKWIYNNGRYLSSDQVHDWKNGSARFSNSDSDDAGGKYFYKYSPSTKAMEITQINSPSDNDAGSDIFSSSDLSDAISDSNSNSSINYLKISPLAANSMNRFKTLSGEFESLSDLQGLVLPANFHPVARNMSNMFSDNSDLISLIIPSNDFTKNARDMSSMFSDDRGLVNLTLPSGFNSTNVSNMSNMFAHDKNLTNLNLPNTFDTDHVTNMSNMFTSDSALVNLMLPNGFNTANVSNMSNMFKHDKKLTNLSLPNTFNTGHVTNMSDMFTSDSKLLKLSLPSAFDTSHVNNMFGMFAMLKPNISVPEYSDSSSIGKKKLEKISQDVLSDHVTDSDRIALVGPYTNQSVYSDIKNDKRFKQSDLNKFRNQGRKLAMQPLPLQMITIQSPNTKFTSDADLPTMYKTNSTGEASIPDDFSKGNVGTFTSTISKHQRLMLGLDNPLSVTNPNPDVGTVNITGTPATYTNWIYSNGKYLNSNQVHDWKYNSMRGNNIVYKYSPSTKAIEFVKFNTPPIFTYRRLIKFFGGVTSNVPYVSMKFDAMPPRFRRLRRMGSMFRDDRNLKSLALPSMFFKYNIKFMPDIFADDVHLQSLILPRNVNATDMEGMFLNDGSLQKLTLPNSFNTSEAINMESMFSGDRSLQSLTLPNSFRTPRVNSMKSMFSGDSSLKTLILPQGFNTKRAISESDNDSNSNLGMSDMFSDDSDLTYLKITSPNTKFGSDSKINDIGEWAPINNQKRIMSLTNGRSHLGTWINLLNINLTPAPQPIINGNLNRTLGIPVAGNQETLPVKFVDQNNHQIGSDVNESGVMGTYIKLPTSVPRGYTLNPNQPTQELAVSNEMDPKDPSKLLPVTLHVTGNHVGVQVQYKLPNGQNVGNAFTIPSRQVGTTVDLTQLGLPLNYALVSDHGDPTRYQLDVSDLAAPGYSQTKVLPVYIAPVSQNLTINYIDPDHNTFLTSRTVPVTSDTRVYLNNNDITNDNGNNANSFVDQNDRVKGYQVESGQNLSPTVHLNASSNSYPIYTVKMQSRPVILHVTYWSSDANSKVGSDNITQNNHGQSSLLGDTMTLPTVANANAHGLVQGYTLDNGQPLTYQAHNVDIVNNGHVIDDVTLLAHGNKVTDQVPVTVDEVDGNGKLQRQDVIDVPVHGNVGDQITFNSSDFQDYVPQGYVVANANNPYNHTDYADHNYTAKLMVSDAGQNRWNPASWQINHGSNYWDATNQRPRFVIQATNQKQITVNFINQDRNKVGSTSFYGSYRDAIDLQNPLVDGQSALNDRLPAGYVYGSNNPSSLTYGQVARTVNINVTGRPTTIKVEYDNPVGHQLINSVDDIDDTHRVGDTVTLPTTHLPKGYVLVSPNDLSYTIVPNNGTVICHLNIIAHTETLPVKFINQNGKVIGNVNDQTQGVIGQNNVALPEAPQGYHYDQSKIGNGNTYDFTADQLDDNHPGLMQQHTVYLQGDTEAVPVEFINQDGKIVPNGSLTKVARIGDQITLPNAPSNYTVDSGQAAQYLLTTNNVNTPGHMKPVKIYVRTNQKYQFNVIAKEKVNGTLIGSVTTPIIVNSSDDKSHTYQPGDYQPSGFTSESGDHPVSTTVTDSGLSTPSVAWIYDAKNSENTTKPDDHQDPQPILVTYHDTDNDHDVMTNHRVDGFMNSQLDVTNPADGGVAVPNGYALNADQSLIHQITTDQQAITLNVHGVHTGVNEFNLNVVHEHHDGTTLTTPQSIVEGGNVNTSFQIKPSDYVPSGYHLDTATAHHKADETVNGTVTADGLSPRSHTFYYAASQVGRDGVKPLVVTYYDDRTGTKVGTHVINDGYMDQFYDVGQLGTNGLKPGYSVDANQNQTYTIGTQPITAHVMVHGNASTNREHDDTVTVQIYKEDPYGHSLSGQPETAYDVITGNVGDSYVVSANDYLPSGYQIDPSKNGDRSLTGTIQSDGSVDHRAVKFYYTMSNQDEDNLQPIHVMYENDLDSDVIADEVISPSKRNDDYVGKFVDVIPTKSNQNADNQQSPVPQGYVVDPKQDTLAGFSNVRPTYIDVLVHNDSNYQYHDQFNQLEDFYDGDRLVDTADILHPITGVDGQRFTVNAPQTPAGYTAAVNNPGVITGYVKGHQLTMDNASYRFNATNSKNYDHPSDHDHAQPILVTFKDGNVTIGQPNQRVDGYMNQTVNVLDHLKVPVDYQTVGGDQFNYLITTNEQRLTIQVIPKVAQNAVVNYEDQDSNHVVAQRAIVAPVGTRLTSLADEYTSLMPYGYGYAGHNSWDDDTRVTDNGQYVVYVTRMDVRARPIVTDNANDGRISVNYENQDGDVIGTYTLNRTDGTPFKLSDYTKSRSSSNGQMPDGFTSPQVVSGESIAKFDKNHLQALTIKVNTNNQLATAKVEYEDVKTHQLIDRTGTNQPLSLTVNGHAGNVINYDSYQRFVPQGYSYYGMGNHDSVIEDGDVDVIMVHKDKPSNNYVGKINVIYRDADTGSDIDNVSVSGLINSLLSLDYYENDLPLGGYEFAGVNGASQGSIKFNGSMQNVTIKVRKPKIQAKSQYGSIKIHFVKADAEGISSMVNGNQRTSDQTLKSYQVPYSYNEVMTGHIGDLFNPEEYEHNTPQGTTFDHIVKGCNVNAITDQPQDVWIAVQSTNGKF